MRSLRFIRHAPVTRSLPRMAYGRLDVPVDANAAQAHAVLANTIQTNWIITSPSTRTRYLADVLAQNNRVAIHIDDRLAELALGAWEGRSFIEIARRSPVLYEARGLNPWHTRPPGGESFADVGRRALAFWHDLESLCPKDAEVVLVGHSGWVRAFACALGALPQAALLTTKVPHLVPLALPLQEDDVPDFPWWFLKEVMI